MWAENSEYIENEKYRNVIYAQTPGIPGVGGGERPHAPGLMPRASCTCNSGVEYLPGVQEVMVQEAMGSYLEPDDTKHKHSTSKKDDRVWSSWHPAINGGAVYWECHPQLRQKISHLINDKMDPKHTHTHPPTHTHITFVEVLSFMQR